MSTSDEEWVRRALSSVRPDEPVPDEVLARLDDRLDRLHREAVHDSGVPLTRRRRVGPYVLAAAAVAAVVAVGIPVVRHLGDGGASPTSAGAASASRGTSVSPTGASPSTSSPQGGARLALTGDTPRLRTAGFGVDVAGSLPQLLRAADAYALGGQEAASSCAAKPAAGTRGALVLLDGRPALVEISAPSDGRRTVRALSCGDGTALASARVAAR